MDFIGTFYNYFIEKHGINSFNEIKDMILSKVDIPKDQLKRCTSKEDFSKKYTVYVFEIALTDYWGMNNKEIEKYVNLTIPDKDTLEISINRVKMMHSDAIKLIQNYLRRTENEVQEEFSNGK